MKRYGYSGRPLSDAEAFYSASEEELRVLLLVLAAGEPISAEELMAAARAESIGEIKDALAFWRGAGLVKAATKKKEEKLQAREEGASEGEKTARPRPVRAKEELPAYSGSELSALIEQGNLASFIEACQQIYGKVLSQSDINILMGLREELRFDCEYICLLLEYYGEKAKKPMRYVEKVGFSLFDRGIVSFEALEAHIERDRRMKTREGALRKMFGIGERALSKTEEEAFVRWCEEYGYDDGLIGLAYDMTVGATGKASVAYADKIISRWNTAGCKSAKDAAELIEKEKQQKAHTAPKKSAKDAEKDAMRSFEVDDFFAHALDRSYGKKEQK